MNDWRSLYSDNGDPPCNDYRHRHRKCSEYRVREDVQRFQSNYMEYIKDKNLNNCSLAKSNAPYRYNQQIASSELNLRLDCFDTRSFSDSEIELSRACAYIYPHSSGISDERFQDKQLFCSHAKSETKKIIGRESKMGEPHVLAHFIHKVNTWTFLFRFLLHAFSHKLKEIRYVTTITARLLRFFFFLNIKEWLRRSSCDNLCTFKFNKSLFKTRRKLIYSYLFLTLVCPVFCNSSPRFVVEKSGEIVVNLREGPDTPIGTVVASIKGFDADGDNLTFGIQGVEGRDLIEVRPSDLNEADLVLRKLLDRELREEYQIILTLTDGKLGNEKYITQSLLLLVEDVNDNEPVFEPYESTIYVSENSPPQVLATLKATDKDEGPYGQVVYTLAGSEEGDNEVFSVRTVGDKAEFKLIGELDYERKSIYQLKILATDRSPGGRINTGTAAVIVEIKDVPDMNPTFVGVPPVTRIPEDIPVNSYVLQVHAIDADRGINNPIEYTMLEGDHGFFELESSSGYLYVKQPLDREHPFTGGAFFIKIKAEEVTDQNPRPSAETEVTVVLEDVNDQIPTFRAVHYIAEVAEGAQFNMPVSLIGDAIPEVYDDDQGINGTFQLEVLGGGGIFDVTPKDGLNLASFLIRVKAPHLLDYENIKEVNFTLIAKEIVDLNPKSSTALVTVHITDTNDNVPEFNSPLYKISVPENSPDGTIIARVYATDPDSGLFGTEGIRYTDVRGTFSDKVRLDPVSGDIILLDSSALDRETWSDIFLTVEARDSNGLGNRNSVGISITIEDVNDNAPEFMRPVYQISIPENAPSFSEPFFVHARDADLNGTLNHEVKYAIVDGDVAGNFSIDPIRGEIKLTGPLNFETINMAGDDRYFNLTVQAYDLGTPSLSSFAQVLIYVSDINDHKPKFEKLQYQVSIPEDTPGETFLMQVYAFDADGSRANSRVAYRIESGAEDKFIIEADTGRLLVARGAVLDPDRTQPRTVSYTLNVIAVDGGIGDEQRREGAVVVVDIEDVNNKPPVFKDMPPVSVNENDLGGTFVAQVEAFDPDDNSELRYFLDPLNTSGKDENGVIVKPSDYNISAAFRMGRDDGVITLMKSVDRERVETIRLAVLCEDVRGFTAPQTASSLLTIVVQDTNDNDPVFMKQFYKRFIAENAEIGTKILSVVATDIDKNKTVSYSVQTPKEVLNFIELDNETGEVFVKSKIDREITPWLNFTARAQDSGIPSRSSFVQVMIKVVDENDNNPLFTNHSSVLIVKENAPIGTPVITLTASDADEGAYGNVTYLLDRRSSGGFFEIDGDTGQISVAMELDREQQDRYDLIVEAWDNYKFGHGTGESRNAFTQITVVIADVNDEAPVINRQTKCADVSEFHRLDEAITTVTAFDNDDPDTPNGRLRFDIIGGNENGLFGIRSIDINSAEIFAAEPLVGRFGNYTLLVTARDMGLPPNDAIEDVVICVSDFNDHPPKFISPDVNVTIKIMENATVGSLVIRVKAVDEDVGANGAVLYRLKADAKGHHKSFSIDRETGELTLRRSLDRENQRKYNIRIEAYDQGIPTPLSTDLDLTVFVSNVNDFQPQFTTDVFTVNFTEHKKAGLESFQLPETVDLDALDVEELRTDVCYFIVKGNEDGAFALNSISHQLKTTFSLDREDRSSYELIVKATEDCFSPLASLNSFDPLDDTLLKVQVFINDVNDNAPVFEREIFTGGITTNSEFGYEILKLEAIDLDSGMNAVPRYYMIGDTLSKTLFEGVEEVPLDPFIVDPETGVVRLNFIPRQGMKGYFDFEVFANDTDGLSDSARVFIYLLREDQRVRFILRMSPEEVRNNVHYLRQSLSNVTGAIVNVDAYKLHENEDGTVDNTKTDLFLHLVNRDDHSVLEVNQVLASLDKNIKHLDSLFKEMNVLETRGAELRQLSVVENNLLFVWLVGVIAFLSLVLIATISICLSQRSKYTRKLKAATTTAFGSQDTGLNRSSTMPNTNLHSVEGSNPIWMSGFDNDWYKDEDSLRYQHFIRHISENGDSVESNPVGSSYNTNSNVSNSLTGNSSLSHDATKSESPPTTERLSSLSDTFRSNIYQTFNKISNPLVEKKLETTEL